MENNNLFIIDERKILTNLENIKRVIGNDTKYCAIVKADAYGLGLETVCSILDGKVDYYGVACLSEALKIRKFDKNTNIIILGVVDLIDIEKCIENNIDISVSSIEYLQSIIKYNNLNIHLQVNTGLNRFGIRSISSFNKALNIIEKSNCRLVGVYSHFATKESDLNFIKFQFYKFLQFKRLCKSEKIVFHIANSFGTIADKRYHLDMVRTGMLMYGGAHNNIGNEFVLSIKSKILAIQNVRKGETVGYDRTFKSKKSMKIAIVGIGYADGIDRRLSNNFYVLINNKKCQIIGLICMDAMMVDVSNIDARMGDEVTILGCCGKYNITIEDMSEAIGASPYELMCRFNTKRMNKIVIRS